MPPNTPDWTAITQTVAAVVQAVGALIALGVTVSVAKRAESNAERAREDAVLAEGLRADRAKRALEDSAGAVLGFLGHAMQRVNIDVQPHQDGRPQGDESIWRSVGYLEAMVARAGAVDIMALEQGAARAVMTGQRVAAGALKYLRAANFQVPALDRRLLRSVEGVGQAMIDLNTAVGREVAVMPQ